MASSPESGAKAVSSHFNKTGQDTPASVKRWRQNETPEYLQLLNQTQQSSQESYLGGNQREGQQRVIPVTNLLPKSAAKPNIKISVNGEEVTNDVTFRRILNDAVNDVQTRNVTYLVGNGSTTAFVSRDDSLDREGIQGGVGGKFQQSESVPAPTPAPAPSDQGSGLMTNRVLQAGYGGGITQPAYADVPGEVVTKYRNDKGDVVIEYGSRKPETSQKGVRDDDKDK